MNSFQFEAGAIGRGHLYLENVGSGLKRIHDVCRDCEVAQPVIEANDNWHAIRFARPILSKKGAKEVQSLIVEGLNEGLKTTLQVIREHPGVQAGEIAAVLDQRPIKTVERHIKTLTDRGLNTRRGSRKTGGCWTLEGRLKLKSYSRIKNGQEKSSTEKR